MEQITNYEDLLTDLLYLRKSEGFKMNRVRNASTFLSTMGGEGQTFDVLKIRFVSAICSLEDEQSVELLLCAYALDPDYEDIESIYDRRKKYGKIINRKYDTLADREDNSIKELAVRILMSKWVNAPLPANIPVIHGAFISEQLDVVSIIKDRTLIETRESQKIISLIDGVKSFDYSTNEISNVEPLEGCTVKTQKISQGIKNILEFPEPLKKGETHLIKFVEKSPEFGTNNKKAVAMEITRSFSIPTFRYNLKVEFVGQKPKIIWHYNMLSILERPGFPEKTNCIQLYENSHIIEKAFNHLHGGMFSGIAWKW